MTSKQVTNSSDGPSTPGAEVANRPGAEPLLTKVPCPCGCRKFIVKPYFGCQCSSLSEKEADELLAIARDAQRYRSSLREKPHEPWCDSRLGPGPDGESPYECNCRGEG